MGLDRLTVARIKRACTGRSYARGAAHYRSGLVESARLSGGAVRATVRDGERRGVEASAGGGRRGLSCACTCPYSRGGACEHAVAVLLYTMDHYAEMAGRAGRRASPAARLVGQAGAGYVQRFLARELAADAGLAGRFARGLGAPPPAGLDYRRWVKALFGEAAAAEAAAAGRPTDDSYVELGDVMETAADLEAAGEFAEAARAYGQIAESVDAYMNSAYPYGDYVEAIEAAKARRAACLARAGGRGATAGRGR